MSIFKRLTWEQVKPVWDTYLWPGRDSEPVTSMMYLGGYDLSYKDRDPIFIGIIDDDGAAIAVNSYVDTVGTEFRSRGLWVHPKYRGSGHARDMLKSMMSHVHELGGDTIWTMPRRGALEAYESVGFQKTSQWKKNDWGVNCYARVDFQ